MQGGRSRILYTFPALSRRTLVLFVCGACLLIVLATRVEHSSVEVKVNPTESNDSYTVDDLFEQLVCLTAISDNHFRESQDHFKSIRRCLPGKRFIVYDLGLNSRNREQLLSDYTNVELRPFPFNDYSHLPHVSDLHSYAWKPIIIDRVSKEYDVIMYGDASLRMISCDMTAAFEHLLKFPILNCHPKSYRAIEFTHDGMIEYLHYPKARIDIAGITTLEASGWLMWTNSFLKRKLIEPWLDCALHQECIAPKGAKLRPCRFTNNHDGHYVGCHRYDQSAINLIMAQRFGLNYQSKCADTAISSKLWVILRLEQV